MSTATSANETMIGTSATGLPVLVIRYTHNVWGVEEGTDIGESFGRGTFPTFADAARCADELVI